MSSLTMGDLNLYRFHNASILNSLSVGDLIEFPRGIYSHWGVYCGNRQVIHMTANDTDRINADVRSGFSICGARFRKARVCIEDFWTVAAGSMARKNNKKDEAWRPRSPAEIVRNALNQRGEVEYNIFYSNCEHFAKWCRYGIAKSDQAEKAMTAGTAIGVVLATGVAAAAIYALGRYCTNNNEEEEEEEKERRRRTVKSKRDDKLKSIRC